MINDTSAQKYIGYWVSDKMVFTLKKSVNTIIPDSNFHE